MATTQPPGYASELYKWSQRTEKSAARAIFWPLSLVIIMAAGSTAFLIHSMWISGGVWAFLCLFNGWQVYRRAALIFMQGQMKRTTAAQLREMYWHDG